MSTYAILNDTTRCVGCEECVAACKKANDLRKDVPRRWKQRIDDLSSTRYTTILRRPGGNNIRQQCRHCVEPACVSACLVGALQKTPEGPVIYDGSKCMGCRYCMTACPYAIPRYAWEEPIPYVHKCTMCYDRLKDGGRPACVEACQHGATVFGSRKELLEEARRRIDGKPDTYVDKVFGETEVGGTCVLYISDIPLDFLGCSPELDDTPLPDLTWAALSKVPYLVGGMGAIMTGTWWVIGRRMKLAEEQKQAKTGDKSRDGSEDSQTTKSDEEK